jgi:predicted dinucleotide-binding enzyme
MELPMDFDGDPKMKVAIIGKGHVGSALGEGLTKAGHEVRFGHRDPAEAVGPAVSWGEAVVLAVPYPQIGNAAEEIGNGANGKVLVDVTNVIGNDGKMAVGCTTSGAEELQKRLPQARVVKALNTVFAQNMRTGKVGGEPLAAFVAGDDAPAKRTVMQLTKDIGFDPIDCGGLSCARYLEPMALQLVNLGYGQGLGADIGFKLVKAR